MATTRFRPSPPAGASDASVIVALACVIAAAVLYTLYAILYAGAF